MGNADPDDELVGALVGGRYRVQRKLGEGGMGRVYVALHESIGKQVALKCLTPEFSQNKMVVERFVREARAATAAGNEHIVEVFDLGTLDDGAPFIVMELLEGRELGELLHDTGPMAVGRAVRILRQACDALAAAHEKGIVHRDLKPENLFLAKRVRDPEFVKVLDFGISKLSETGAVQKLTGTGMTLGTPHYMSAEQAQGLPSVDHRTDIYALGVILFEMLAGQLPFDADTFPLLVVAIVTQSAPSVRRFRTDVPEELAEVIARCLAKTPQERFETVAQLSEALAPFADFEGAPVVTGARVEAATIVSRINADRAPVPLVDTAAVASQVVSGSKLPIVMLFVGLGVLGAGGAFYWSRVVSVPSPTDVEVPTTPPDVVQIPEVALADAAPAVVQGALEPSEVEVSVVVSPQQAKLFIDGEEYPNPLTVRRTASGRPARLRAEASGYETREELVVFDRPLAFRWGLVERRGRATSMSRMESESTTTMSAMGGFRDEF